MNTEPGLLEDLSTISRNLFPDKYQGDLIQPITWEEFEKEGMPFVYGNPDDF